MTANDRRGDIGRQNRAVSRGRGCVHRRLWRLKFVDEDLNGGFLPIIQLWMLRLQFQYGKGRSFLMTKWQIPIELQQCNKIVLE